MPLFSSLKSNIGNLIDVYGTRYKLPEWGLSELVAGRSTINTGRTPQSRSSGFTQTSARSTGTAQPTAAQTLYRPPAAVQSPQQQNNLPAPQRGIIDQAPAIIDTGGGGGSSDFFEPTPPPPSFNELYGSEFDAALSALDDRIGALQAGSSADISGIESKGTIQRQAQETGLAEAKGELAGQERKAKAQTEENINQQRRTAAEVFQGIQSRFGGTTGTGQFVSEIYGRQMSRNIAQAQNTFSETLREIGLARSNTIAKVNQNLFEIDQNTEQLKKEAQAALKKDISDISSQKALIGIERAKEVRNAVTSYQSLVASINARNTAFRQDLFKKQQDFDNQLKLKQIGAIQNYAGNVSLQLKTIGDKNYLFNPKTGSLTSAKIPTGSEITPDKNKTANPQYTTGEDEELFDLANSF